VSTGKLRTTFTVQVGDLVTAGSAASPAPLRDLARSGGGDDGHPVCTALDRERGDDVERGAHGMTIVPAA